MSGERTAEEWGRVAVSLPGFRWMAGMLAPGAGRVVLVYCDGWAFIAGRWIAPDDMRHYWPDPDDPATAGCLEALLGDDYETRRTPFRTWAIYEHGRPVTQHSYATRGIARIAVAEALGRWPGGAA